MADQSRLSQITKNVNSQMTKADSHKLNNTMTTSAAITRETTLQVSSQMKGETVDVSSTNFEDRTGLQNSHKQTAPLVKHATAQISENKTAKTTTTETGTMGQSKKDNSIKEQGDDTLVVHQQQKDKQFDSYNVKETKHDLQPDKMTVSSSTQIGNSQTLATPKANKVAFTDSSTQIPNSNFTTTHLRDMRILCGGSSSEAKRETEQIAEMGKQEEWCDNNASSQSLSTADHVCGGRSNCRGHNVTEMLDYEQNTDSINSAIKEGHKNLSNTQKVQKVCFVLHTGMPSHYIYIYVAHHECQLKYIQLIFQEITMEVKDQQNADIVQTRDTAPVYV